MIFYIEKACRDKENLKLSFDTLEPTELTKQLSGYLYGLADKNYGGEIGFVFPKGHQISGEQFLSYFTEDQAMALTYSKNVTNIVFENEKELEKHSNEDKDGRFIAGIVFGDDYTDYTIRIKGPNTVDTKVEPIGNYAKSRDSEIIDTHSWIDKVRFKYVGITLGDVHKQILLPLQMALDRTIISMKTNGKINGYTAEVGKLSKPSIEYMTSDEDNRQMSYSGYAPVIAFIFIGQVFHLGNRLMEDKESGTREGLITIGANRILLWLGWVLIYLPFSVIIMILAIVFDPPHLMDGINRIIFFVTLFLYALSIYELVVIFSLIAKKHKTVMMLTCFAFFSLLKVNEEVFKLKMNGHEKIEKILSLIFSPIGISMSQTLVTFEDNRLSHIGFSNIFKHEYGIYLLFLFIDVIAYFFIAVAIDYLSGINFKTFGIKSSQKNASDEITYANDIQEDPVGSECYVQVRNIFKYFKFRRSIGNDDDGEDAKLGKVFAANRNISFNVYKDEIFAILGHNGAGKSTLIQNMIGMLRPDAGETFYNGLPISKNKKAIHKNLGICLQSNVLINGFTVADHFKFFSGIKGVTDRVDIDEWLRDIDLVEKRDYDVQKLSGGQKRKVCIGLALLGDPKYVFLDEPTTGLDPLSRRKIWSLLLKKKKDRVIFITTHYMDEADIIADRKLILNKGHIRCLGSSVYLKSHFQMKYNLEVETNDYEAVEGVIRKYIPDAIYFNNKTTINDGKYNVASNASSCHIWKLPIEASPIFSSLLKDLENEKGHILHDFSLNAPILEELFVQLEREKEEENDEKVAIELPKIDSIKRPNELITALRLARYRIRLYFRRKLYILMGVILPFLILFIVFPKLAKNIDNIGYVEYPKVKLNSDLYKNQQWNYEINESGMSKDITDDIIVREFPKLANASNSITHYSSKQMVQEGYGITSEPYYVASFSGDFDETIKAYNFNVYYNDSMPFSAPSTLNALSNAILASNNVNDTIQASTHPLKVFNLNSLTYLKYEACMIVAISVAFTLSFYGSNIVHERTAKLLKQLQLNGITNKSYWLSLVISDYTWFLLTVALVVLAIIVTKFSPLLYTTSLVVVASFLVIASLSCILFQYCVSFLFSSESSAYIFYLLINILPTFYFTSKTITMSAENDSDDFTDFMYYGAIILDTFFPNYCFIRVFKNLISLGIEHETINRSISFSALLLTKKSQINCHFIGAFLSIIFYTLFLIFLTNKKYKPTRKNVYEITSEMNKAIDKEMREGDDDIYYEYQRVKADQDANNIPIKVVTLTKEYDELNFTSSEEVRDAMKRTNPKYGEYHLSNVGSRRIVMTAFENVTLGIDKCECFGILGPNGSGKSSLLNTTSFTYKQTLGDIYYDGNNTLERKGNEITLGYCPQEDTLWSEMTLLEHIQMFLYIRGYSRKESKKLAKQFIQYCRLTPHKNKLPSEMSGGTRRKLNILIALCCSSSKIMLDEPSAGMDPSTRRYVWDIIKATIQSNQSSTIMTTHSMEEAELLCNRIGIMVNGKLQCIGSPEHLKIKFGNTYILDVHTDDVEKFQHEVVEQKNLFGDGTYQREDKSLHRVKYEVKNTSDISRVFEIMEACRDEKLFIDYSYSQTSLEQVFLNFAALKKNQE